MLKKFISYYKPHKKMFFLDLLAAFFISICDLFYPVLTGRGQNRRGYGIIDYSRCAADLYGCDYAD